MLAWDLEIGGARVPVLGIKVCCRIPVRSTSKWASIILLRLSRENGRDAAEFFASKIPEAQAHNAAREQTLPDSLVYEVYPKPKKYVVQHSLQR